MSVMSEVEVGAIVCVNDTYGGDLVEVGHTGVVVGLVDGGLTERPSVEVDFNDRNNWVYLSGVWYMDAKNIDVVSG